MKEKPHILITNDDGILADGIRHLWKALIPYFTITIVAPHSQKSGAGLSTSMTNPLEIKAVPWDRDTPAWSVSGTPTDCIKMALSVILKKPPDLIVSGINPGSNSGGNVLYSGTVGCVIEAAIRNIPGIAFSSESFTNPQFSRYEKYIPSIVDYFYHHPMKRGCFVNVTFPSNFSNEVQGIKMARQGRSHWIENPDKRLHPEGYDYYWLGGKWHYYEEREDSDNALLKQGFITAVPIFIHELTDMEFLENHRESFEKLFDNCLAMEK